MEGAGDESFFRHTAVFETTDGDFWLAIDVAGQFFHRLFLFPMAGRIVAHVMVGCTSAGHLAYFPHTCQVDSCIAHSFGSHYPHEC